MNRFIVWGAIFAGGVWVGVQLCKHETADRFKAAVADGFKAVGLGPDKPYGRDATTWANYQIDEAFK